MGQLPGEILKQDKLDLPDRGLVGFSPVRYSFDVSPFPPRPMVSWRGVGVSLIQGFALSKLCLFGLYLFSTIGWHSRACDTCTGYQWVLHGLRWVASTRKAHLRMGPWFLSQLLSSFALGAKRVCSCACVYMQRNVVVHLCVIKLL